MAEVGPYTNNAEANSIAQSTVIAFLPTIEGKIDERIVNGFQSAIDLTSPVPTKPGVYIASESGPYPNYGGLTADLSQGRNEFYFNPDGTFSKVVVAVDPNAYASKDYVSDIQSNAQAFNYLYEASQTPSLFALQGGASGVSSVQMPGVLPYPFASNGTSFNGNGNSFIAITVPVTPTDAVRFGAWFNKTIFSTAGVAQIGIYPQQVDSTGAVIESNQLTFASSEVVNGATKISGPLQAMITDVVNDYFYIEYTNPGTLNANTAGIIINFFVQGGSTPYTLYFYNPTAIKSAIAINNRLIYDNSALVGAKINSISAAVTTLQTAVNDTTTQQVLNTKSKSLNLLEYGNKSTTAWTIIAGGGSASLNFYPNDASHQGRTTGLYFLASGVTNGAAFFSRTFPLLPNVNIAAGFWFRHTDNIPGLMGFYLQISDGTNPEFDSARIEFNAAERVTEGANRAFGNYISRIEKVDGDWSYISIKSTSPTAASVKTMTVNIFQSGIPNGGGCGVFFEGFTMVYDTVVYPYLGYTNSNFSKFASARAVVVGDSIIDQGNVTNGLATLVNCFIDKSLAVSGSGMTTNGNLVQPPMIDNTRVGAIAGKNPDLIILEGGVNDFRLASPLGTIADAGGTDYSKFYAACYKYYSTAIQQNPNTPILAIGSHQEFYLASGGSEANRENPTKPNSLGLYQIDYVNACEAVAGLLGIPFLNMYKNSGINQFTYASRLLDGLHPLNDANGLTYAKPIAGAIEKLM